MERTKENISNNKMSGSKFIAELAGLVKETLSFQDCNAKTINE